MASNGGPSRKQPPGDMSDQDWEVQTGRAIHIIQNTLPDFFSIGLVTRISNEDDNASSSPESSLSILSKTIPSFPHLIGTDKTKDSLPSAEDIPIDEHNEEHDLEPIYSPKVKLVYSPPDKLPPPFPETLKVEGLPLYLASSSVVRHTLNALYTDLTVDIRKFSVSSSSPFNSSSVPSPSPRPGSQKLNRKREKSLLVRLAVTGRARVSGSPAEWEVNSTYNFSPNTGLIYEHIVNSIQPAPHAGVFDFMRLALGKLRGPGATPSPTGCHGGEYRLGHKDRVITQSDESWR
ncbi:uncharacterized protein STEHIDRAFT_123439 [Stereum hirsutum FP-91666 SS1]|uniref:uncharacterized protein n=1 Tax=Stereum hirsutum (strain FP-91666) TaxID=721885 RepID=UPI00044495C8|nr:uncharacterized protein STEHIDRAFT_123439 [Stereum hirsutum FP-91666 SS1]EIM83864.1 hypothetical protein STEHIDRAFT_123439 [Stereum hirsutum FP-91666 SS1]